MKKNVILLPRVMEKIKETTANENSISLDEYIRKQFLFNNDSLLYRERENGELRIWGKDISLICTGAQEAHSLKAVAVKETALYQYVFAVEKGLVLEGPWEFISSGRAEGISARSAHIPENSLEFLADNLARHKRFSRKETAEYRSYVDYWRNLDIAKRYEEEMIENKKKASIAEYKKIVLNHNDSRISLHLAKTQHSYRSGDRIVLLDKESWNQVYELNSEHINKVSGLEIGDVDHFDSTNQILKVKSEVEILQVIMKDKKFKKGFLWVDDKGSRSKLRRENEALKRLFNGETANARLKDFIPEIQNLEPFFPDKVDEIFLSEVYKEEYPKKQKEAVKKALSCSDIYLIQGPPGTGKTTVISEMAHYLVRNQKKVLLSSQTNLAVDNVLEKIGHKEHIKAIRIGSEERFLLDSKKYSLERRVWDLQEQIQSSLKDNQKADEEAREALTADEPIYMAHKEFAVLVPAIVNILSNYTATQKEVDSGTLQRDLFQQRMQDMAVTIQQLGRFEDAYKERLERIDATQNRSREPLEENARISRISTGLHFNPEDEEDINNYRTLLQILGHAVEKIKEVQRLLREREGEKAGQLRELAEIANSIDYLKQQKSDIKAELHAYITRDIEAREDEYHVQYLGLKDILFHIDSLEKERGLLLKQKEELVQTLLFVKEKVEHQIKVNADLWQRILGRPGITKEEFLNLVDKVQHFQEEFAGIAQLESRDFLELEKFREYKQCLLEKQKLQSEKKNLEEILRLKGKSLQEYAARLKDFEDQESTGLYLGHYQMKVIDISLEKELSRCDQYVKEYDGKKERLELYALTRELQQAWYNKLGFYQGAFENIYIKISNLICATCLGISSTNNNYFLDTVFDYIIIDEAARATSVELLIPMIRGRKIILVGDHKQISPGIEKSILDRMQKEEHISEEEMEAIYKKSLFGIMFEDADDILKTFLNRQFRMSKDISKVVSRLFYDGKLLDGDKISFKSHGLERYLKRAFYWVDTSNYAVSTELEDNTSYYNKSEVNAISSILDWLDAKLQTPKTVGIISPYRAQTSEMEETLSKEYTNLTVEINTIDAFQGREKNFIIMSLVRNNTRGSVGHMGFDPRINVALSRAQELLLIVGNREFIQKNPHRVGKLYNVVTSLQKNGGILRSDFFKAGDLHEYRTD